MLDQLLGLRCNKLPGEPSAAALPRVQKIKRESQVLHASPFVEQEDVLSLNLTRGCVHRCPFCSIRAHPSYPGDEVVQLYKDTAEHLDEELGKRRIRPRAVFISPSTDPFPPVAEIQAETARMVDVLAAHEVEAWLMTRGYIRPSALSVLGEHREWVKVTVALATLDRNLQRILEPLCASPRLRLRQIADLRNRGIRVQVALEPLIPGLTDTRENLAALLEALATAGIRHVRTSYLFLRSGIRDTILHALEPLGWSQAVSDAYAGGPVLSEGAIAPALYLPKARRQRGYAALMAMAAGYGITVSICGPTNPDFRGPQLPRARTPAVSPLFSRLA